jgi:hypothetical protein
MAALKGNTRLARYVIARTFRSMAQQDEPFRYLTQEEFLALPETERAAYLKRVTDHLARRVDLLAKRQDAKKS